MPRRAERPQRRARCRAGRAGSAATPTISTPAASSASRRRKSTSDAATIQSGAAPAPCDQPAAERQAQRAVDDDAHRRAARQARQAAGQLRIVGQRRADADHDRVMAGAQADAPQSRATSPVIQRLSPEAVAMRPSRVVASLSVTNGRPSRTRRRKPALSAAAASRLHADLGRDAGRAQRGDAARRRRADRDPRAPTTTRADAGGDQRVGAGRRLAVMAHGSSVT